MSDTAAIRPSGVTAIPLATLVGGIDVRGDVDSRVPVSGISLDSRDIVPGCLYVALPGRRAHGADFAAAAVAAGAVAVATDAQGEQAARATGVPTVVSDDLRRQMALLSSRVFGDPGSQLELLGVTGTNGKTTTVALLESGLAAAGRRAGTVGTLGFRLDGLAVPSGRSTVTTPDSPDLNALLAVMRERGADTVALEVSSHALKLDRVVGLRFSVAAFLNLGEDHMDFHVDLDDYFEAKASLFTPEYTNRAVVWTDDERGVEVARRATAAGLEVITVGTGEDTRYRLEGYEPVAPLGGRATLTQGTDRVEIRIGMPGYYNMIDAAVAFAMLAAVGLDPDDILTGLASAQVPGRMQALELGPDAPTVVVDFAHTPQAVAAALDALRGSFARVVTVVGCGGDRDAGKRPGMGRAAAERSDVVVITDDNPRTEDPAAIRAATLAGALEVGGDVVVEEVDGRRAAIRRALELADPDTVVAVLGKGHEQGQHVGGQVLPFDDAVEALGAWDRIREGRS
ncbi:UDP-N-acetylmuramoyl-L-alanyl-D-glutamate--2,6-diaminopimelate ligase [Tessaracoccus terricola]